WEKNDEALTERRVMCSGARLPVACAPGSPCLSSRSRSSTTQADISLFGAEKKRRPLWEASPGKSDRRAVGDVATDGDGAAAVASLRDEPAGVAAVAAGGAGVAGVLDAGEEPAGRDVAADGDGVAAVARDRAEALGVAPVASLGGG